MQRTWVWYPEIIRSNSQLFVTPKPETPTPQAFVGTYTHVHMPTRSHTHLQIIKNNKIKYFLKEKGRVHASLFMHHWKVYRLQSFRNLFSCLKKKISILLGMSSRHKLINRKIFTHQDDDSKLFMVKNIVWYKNSSMRVSLVKSIAHLLIDSFSRTPEIIPKTLQNNL